MYKSLFWNVSFDIQREKLIHLLISVSCVFWYPGEVSGGKIWNMYNATAARLFMESFTFRHICDILGIIRIYSLIIKPNNHWQIHWQIFGKSVLWQKCVNHEEFKSSVTKEYIWGENTISISSTHIISLTFCRTPKIICRNSYLMFYKPKFG